MKAKDITGYEGKYRVWPDGRVERWGAAGWVRVSAYGSPPRVSLYIRGKRWQPYVHTLLKRVFDEAENVRD